MRGVSTGRLTGKGVPARRLARTTPLLTSLALTGLVNCATSGLPENQSVTPISDKAQATSSQLATTPSPVPSLVADPLPTPAPPKTPQPPSFPPGAQQRSPGESSPSSCEARVGKTALRRSVLSHTLDAGLGNWLRGVDVEPRIEHGRFQGWLVRGLFNGDVCWRDVDLQIGDIVNRVNRRSIEKPEQAHALWKTLRNADQISVDYTRAGQPRTLTFSVVEDMALPQGDSAY